MLLKNSVSNWSCILFGIKKKKQNSESGYKDRKAGNSLPLSLRKAESDTKEQGSQKWLILLKKKNKKLLNVAGDFQ